MCLIGLALDAHPRFALVIAANRDEHFHRATAPLDWWRIGDAGPWVLGGRDLAAGGTWLGLAANGRIAALTNVRDPQRHRADAASRGGLVTAALADAALPTGTNPYNLVQGNLLDDNAWTWRGDRVPTGALGPGVRALSNAALDTRWPKVRLLTHRLGVSLQGAQDADALSDELFARLADREPAPDADLPDTGVGLDRERWLSPAFIVSPDLGYGTRCSTVIIGERDDDGWHLQVAERSFAPGGQPLMQRAVRLEGWPRSSASRPAVTETRLA